jgi:anti-anti-sigma factor
MADNPQSPLTPTVVVACSGESSLRVTVIGELDTPGVNRLREHVNLALEQPHPTTIELDLDGVPFLDAAAAIQLRRLYLHVAAAGSRMSITAAHPFTWWLLNAFTLTSASPTGNGHPLQPEPGS